MKARTAVVLALALSGGCYQTHPPLDPPLDAAPEPDAGPCEAPPRGSLEVRAELLSATPVGCARVGATFTRQIDLGGDVITAECLRGSSVLTPTADGCGLTIDAECFGLELERYVDGTLRGPTAEGNVRVHQWFGFAFAECDRVERWSIPD